MANIQTTITIIHTVIALAIIGLVLIQRGKGADAGAAFGAGASGTVFGSRGSTSFFSRATAVLATAFFATSLTLAYLSSQRGATPESLLERAPGAAIEQPAPQIPATAQPATSVLPTLDEVAPSVETTALPTLDGAETTGEPVSEE